MPSSPPESGADNTLTDTDDDHSKITSGRKYKLFMVALKSPGIHRSVLMHDLHSADYHLLWGYYLQHTLGEFDNRKAKGHKIG